MNLKILRTMLVCCGTVLFVATNGNDNWSGHLSAPNQRETDGPMASLAGALEAMRRSRQSQGGSNRQSGTIFLRGGIYYLPENLVVRPADSDLEIAAFGKERPVVSGGQKISGWNEVNVGERKLWAAQIEEGRARNWFFRELWVNGERAIRARHPNRGYLKVTELPDKMPEWSKGQSRFRFAEGDIKPWPTLTNAEVVAMTRWVESRLPVASLDTSNRLLNFRKRAVFELAPGDPYYVEHAFEALDEPGEWYFDRHTSTLYYLPRLGERLAVIEAIAPRLTEIIRLEGHPEKGELVERINFRGITFSHSEWYFPEQSQGATNLATNQLEPGGFSQAAIGVPGAVRGDGVQQCRFENCAFLHLGNYALELARGCQSNLVTGCEFADLGAGGIKLGETRLRDNAAEQTRANEVSDCDIHDGGKLFASAVGVWIGQSPDNRLSHNVIHDFYYTGISIGWTWGYGPASASNNLIEFNHVHHIGVKSNGDGPILSDMGGIYTLGKQPGTRIINNLWHDIAAIQYGGWGIYFDEGSSGILAQSNLVYRTTHGGFHQHYGETNLVRNNIFAFARDHQLQRTRNEPHPSFTFQTNIIYFDSGAVLAGDWSNDKFDMDWNIYFDARKATGSLTFSKATEMQWRERAHDVHSLLQKDPLFVSPQKNDFRLDTNSPAIGLGFQAIYLDHVGIRKSLKN